jgi:hypothetical protein
MPKKTKTKKSKLRKFLDWGDSPRSRLILRICLWTFVVLGLGFDYVDKAWQEHRLNQNGVITIGQVTDIETTTDSHQNPKYLISYQFTAKDERVYYSKGFGLDNISKVSVSEMVWAKYDKGDKISVQYLRSDPTVNRPADSINSWREEARRGTFIFGFMVLALIGFELFFVFLDFMMKHDKKIF